MPASLKMVQMTKGSSFIRKMFETGARLKAQFGNDKVFDFSIGNPDLEPPAVFTERLKNWIDNPKPGKHGYMSNAGYQHVRDTVAKYVSKTQEVAVTGNQILMTVGAGGALNVALKSIINPGDEVLVFTPCFVEYGFYVDNHGGVLKFIPSQEGFELDLDALKAAVNEKTAALIINSPNNPTGKVYNEKTIIALAETLRECSKKTGRSIYLLSDEPYRKIVFDGVKVPPLFKHYKDCIVTTSFSKDLSLPGERIGFLAVHPQADDVENLVSAMVLCNRILGYVNAPAIMQNAVCDLLDASVDVGVYQRRRDLFYDALTAMGYEMTKPEGTFYLFPKAPGGDDLKIVDALQEENILVVPGRGFKAEGFFRIAFCVDESVIQRSLPGFERAIKKFL